MNRLHLSRTYEYIRDSFLDLLAPQRAKSARVAHLNTSALSPVPFTHTLLGAEIISLLDYQTPSVRDCIHALKYEHSSAAAHLCADVLADYLYDDSATLRLTTDRDVLIIPIPLHSSRLKQRGYNQVQRILDALPADMRTGPVAQTAPTCLTRHKATPHQTALSRTERLSNVRSAFSVPEQANLRGTHVYLIDDVATTGATLVHAGQALEEAGAHVTRIALARA